MSNTARAQVRDRVHQERDAISGHTLEPETNPNRLEILSAAALAFMQEGYAATSIDMIAERLGATKGRIYYYFKSKTDIFFAIHRQATLTSFARIRPIAKGPGTAIDRMQEIVRMHIELLTSHAPLMRVASQGLDSHAEIATTRKQREMLDTLLALRSDYEKIYMDLIDEGIRTGEFRRCDPLTVVRTMLNGMNWIAPLFSSDGNANKASRKKIAEEVLSFYFNGIVAAPQETT